MPPAPKTKADKPKPPDSLAHLRPQRDSANILPRSIVVTGQTGAGKTSLAATIIPEIAEALQSPPAKMRTLASVVWLSADEQALVALQAKNLEPEFEIDIKAMAANEPNMETTLNKICDNLEELQSAADAKILVWDTVSTLGDYLTAWHVYGAGCPTAQSGAKNTMRGWGKVGDEYRKLYVLASALGYRQIILAHPKSNAVEEDATDPKAGAITRAQATVEGAPGDNLIIPATAGRAFARFLNGACSIQAWLRAEDETRGGTTTRVRTLMPYGGEGARGKVRYEGILDREEPADLAALDQKILEAIQ